MTKTSQAEGTAVTRRTSILNLVLIVSFAHAMVHLIEQSFASVEQIVSDEFHLTTRQSGSLGSALRIPFGFGALLTGILADRIGAARVLVVYLAGIALVCFTVPLTQTETPLIWQLLLLGTFASMYHPAGLALLSTSTSVEERGRALGIHGVFGSLGLAAAPVLAGIVLAIPNTNWRHFFLVLGVVSGVLAVMFRIGFSRYQAGSHQTVRSTAQDDQEYAPASLQVAPFVLLMVSSACSGIVYGGFLHFLKRYLSEVDWSQLVSWKPDTIAGVQSGLVLFFGVAGQWLSGVLAKPHRLKLMLSVIYLIDAPLLFWMSQANGHISLVPCCLLALVHFMNQPVYNSLLPEYVPVKTRSTWFGVSQMMTFGIGALGPTLVGSFDNYRHSYVALSIISVVSGLLPFALPRARPEGTMPTAQ
ncbi:MAG: MFS transporter [Planctomycetaceae bacterium]|nr:MFS transporter [Planctomycetaceae bacterium]